MPERKNIFFHRDLSWLAFNDRVLNEATDKNNPLLERLRFLSIAANNLDEFFMVRVSSTKRLVSAGHNHKDQFGYYLDELLVELSSRIESQILKMYNIYHEILNNELEKNKIFILSPNQLNEKQKKATRRYFETTLFPIITPIAVDPTHPFPVLHSKTNAFALSLNYKENVYFAFIVIPKSVPRFYRLPSDDNEFCFIFIDEIIREHLGVFFRGFQIGESFAFRVIRDGEIILTEEFATDFLKKMEEELKNRPKAEVVSLQIEDSKSDKLVDFLSENLKFPKTGIIFVKGNLDLSSLGELSSQITKPNLFYASYSPGSLVYENIFDKIKEGDFIIHLPYQSFYPVVDFIQTSAKDPDVLAIKMSLYRTNDDSNIIRALIEAAKNKKQVTVLVELRARFDEERNIEWTKELESAGCHVIYGMPGLKVHAKMAIVVRKEEGRIRRYVHLSTGNYNEKTARIYTDVGYFTASDDFANDVSDIFNVITGYSMAGKYRKVITSPNELRSYIFELIDREMHFQKKHKSGLIFAKMNSLEDVSIINKLYQASCSGVKIKLIVRGICSLIPGMEGISENIEIKSIVGRFLEHSRIFVFNNNHFPRVFLSSADWMSRNFDRRVEVLFEILRQDLIEHMIMILDRYWEDNAKSYILMPNGEYVRHTSEDKCFNAQEYFIDYYAK